MHLPLSPPPPPPPFLGDRDRGVGLPNRWRRPRQQRGRCRLVRRGTSRRSGGVARQRRVAAATAAVMVERLRPRGQRRRRQNGWAPVTASKRWMD